MVPHAFSAWTFSPSAARFRNDMSFFSSERRYHARALFFSSARRRILSLAWSRYSLRFSGVRRSFFGRSLSFATSAMTNCWRGRPSFASAATIFAASLNSRRLPDARELRSRTIASDDVLAAKDAETKTSAQSAAENILFIAKAKSPSLRAWRGPSSARRPSQCRPGQGTLPSRHLTPPRARRTSLASGCEARGQRTRPTS